MSNANETSTKLPSTTNASPALLSDQGAAVANVPSDGYINLRVITSDMANEVHFRLKSEVPLVRMKIAYCKKLGLNKDELRFMFDGYRITDNDTPAKLGMIDGDVIEIYQERLGGGM